MKCFRCGSENVVKRTRYDVDSGEPREQTEPDKWVPFMLGQDQYGHDTHVTLCQPCSGDVIKLLRGEAVPPKKFDVQEVLDLKNAR